MSRMPWFRMYYEARSDAKLRSLADDEFRVWFNLLCFAAEQDEERGSIDMSDPFIVALEVSGGDEELLSRVCHALSRLKIVTFDDVTLTFCNFANRQYDKPSDRPEQTRERQRKKRATTRDSGQPDGMSRDVTRSHALDTDTDTEKKEDASASSRARARRAHRIPDDFQITTTLRGWGHDHGMTDAEMDRATERFVNYWQGAGKTKSDWPATWRNWMLREMDEGRLRPAAGEHRGLVV